MTPPTQLWIVPVLLGLGACAMLRPEPEPEQNAGLRLERGLTALDAGEFRAAFDELAWVYGHCPGREAGMQALVAMAALELDPRNRARRPGVGTDLTGRVIRDPTPPDWVRPLAEAAYLMALSLGAPPAAVARTGPVPTGADTAGVRVARAADVLEPPAEEPAYGCGQLVVDERWVPPALPRLPGPSLVALLAGAESQRDSAQSRAATLEQELVTVRERLEDTERELERIRQTLKP